MCDKKFWFEIINNCNIGTIVTTYNVEPGEEGYQFIGDYLDENEKVETPEEVMEIDSQLPSDGKYRIYIVNEHPSFYPVFNKDISSDLDCQKIYWKLFSQIHGCLPIKEKKESIYDTEIIPNMKITPEIANMDNIIDDDNLINIIEEETEGYYFLFIVDSLGNPKLSKVI